MSISKILIANRGEIACRIIKTASEIGIQTVAIYAPDDQKSRHVIEADEAYPLGDGNMRETYLNITKIIQIALAAKCDAIHPGYGFLSENSLFAQECQNHDLIFIGPAPSILKQMGDKQEARIRVKELGIPVPEGFECSVKELMSIPQLKYPLIIKPVLGGGGKGMHIVHNREELQDKFKTASREAVNYFADTRVYFEQYIEKARHIEVQIAADHDGNIIHLFDRECTIQRNFQKFIEEAPSPSLTAETRNQITTAAVQIARACGYTNIGTVEFLLDEQNQWCFIEMNTRIQVEHPVTEAITGIDLVRLQIEIAAGNPMPFTQEQIHRNGHAIEVRINAENPEKNFRPSSGLISLFSIPVHSRFDTFINAPYQLPSQYDSLLGKLIAWDTDRTKAIRKTVHQLYQVHIQGLDTNLNFIRFLLSSSNFKENRLYTTFVRDILESFLSHQEKQQKEQPFYIPVIAFVYVNFQLKYTKPVSVWEDIGYWRIRQEVRVNYQGKIIPVRFEKIRDHLHYTISGTCYETSIMEVNPCQINIQVDNSIHPVQYSFTREGRTIVEINGLAELMESPDILLLETSSEQRSHPIEHPSNNLILAPLHGRVIKINVMEKAKINRGDVLLVIESMKTENSIVSPRNGLVKSIHVMEGTQVRDNMILMELE